MPDRIMPEKADMWQFLAMMRASEGPQQAMIAAWIPTVDPLTRNHVASAPNAAAAKSCAALMGPVGVERMSRPVRTRPCLRNKHQQWQRQGGREVQRYQRCLSICKRSKTCCQDVLTCLDPHSA